MGFWESRIVRGPWGAWTLELRCSLSSTRSVQTLFGLSGFMPKSRVGVNSDVSCAEGKKVELLRDHLQLLFSPDPRITSKGKVLGKDLDLGAWRNVNIRATKPTAAGHGRKMSHTHTNTHSTHTHTTASIQTDKRARQSIAFTCDQYRSIPQSVGKCVWTVVNICLG